MLYQNIDAFLTEGLSQTNPVTNCKQWPTLFRFCEYMAELATRKVCTFYLCVKRLGLKDHRDVIARPNYYCNPGPSFSALDSRILAPFYKYGPHLKSLMLLLTLLDSLDGVPCIMAPWLKKNLVVLHDNGMPLNLGTFPRQEDGETFFDDIIPHITQNKMRELYQQDNTAVHKFIAEDCSWISEVKDFDVCDASEKVHVNIFTKFCSSRRCFQCKKGTM